MSRELEALENIKHYDSRVGLHESDYKLIETALKNNDEDKFLLIKQVRELKDENASIRIFNDKLWAERQRNEKKFKALEIIKEKFVVPAYIRNTKNVEKYNEWLKQETFRKDYLKRKLTQEEYDLLKEVLK